MHRRVALISAEWLKLVAMCGICQHLKTRFRLQLFKNLSESDCSSPSEMANIWKQAPPGDLCNSPVLESGSPERVYATFLIPVNHFKSTNWLTDNRSPTTKRFNAIAEQPPVYPRSQGSCHLLCILMWLSYKQQLMWMMSQFLYSMWGKKSLLRLWFFLFNTTTHILPAYDLSSKIFYKFL